MNRYSSLISRTALTSLILTTLCLARSAHAQSDCPTPKYLAPLPAGIEDPVKPWGTTDTGAIVDGFVGLTSPDGILHGIDVSRDNTISNYSIYSKCGGKFAFVKLDDAYPHHVSAMLKEHWVTIPYVFFNIPTDMRQPQQYASISSSDTAKIDAQLQRFAEIGAKAAEELPSELKRFSGGEVPEITFAGMTGRILALDVEQKLTDESNPRARLVFGRNAARAVCTWISHVKQIYPDTMVIIYSTPSVFGDYLNFAYQQDDDCLRGLPIWMARTTRDGGDLIGMKGSKDVNDRYAQRTCLQPAGNRCIVHQYSHRGVVGVVLPVTDPHTPHVDFDRAFQTKAVSDSTTTQYVRR